MLGYIRVARRPILLLGGGCVRIDEVMLNELVDVLDMPVVYTFMGKVRSNVPRPMLCVCGCSMTRRG